MTNDRKQFPIVQLTEEQVNKKIKELSQSLINRFPIVHKILKEYEDKENENNAK